MLGFCCFPEPTTADWDVWPVRNAETCRFDGCLGTENHPSLQTPSNSFKKKSVYHIESSFKLDATSTQVKTRLRHSEGSASPYWDLCVFFYWKRKQRVIQILSMTATLAEVSLWRLYLGETIMKGGLIEELKRRFCSSFFFFAQNFPFICILAAREKRWENITLSLPSKSSLYS